MSVKQIVTARVVNMQEDTINWSAVPERYRFMARNSTYGAANRVAVYVNRPIIRNKKWISIDPVGGWRDVHRFENARLTIGTCDWNDSLIER